jgi:NifU-like protein involved in Fe-S cluster formation
MKKSLLLLSAVMFTVPGCATMFRGEPTVNQASADSVTYRIKGAQLDRARALADEHCAVVGRRAVQDRVDRAEGNDRLASFNCV